MAARYRAGSSDTRLHEATKKKDVISLLSQIPPVDVNGLNEEGNTALHCYINRRRDEGYPLLLCLLTNCDTDRIDLDKPGPLLNTPLHLAAQVGDIDAAKALIAFGADIDALNINHATPLDIACNDDTRDFLFFVGSESGDCVRQRLDNFKQLPPPTTVPVSLDDGVDWRELSQSTDLTSLTSSIPAATMDNYSAWLRWREKQKTLQEQKKRRSSCRRRGHHSAAPPVFKAREGHRVLCLDGGGMRGLILIEVLSFITQTTGRKITDLFEWIVATSTGAIVALALAYADLNVQQVRQLYFEMKEKVFGTARFGYCCDTEAKEELLKKVFGDKRMLPLDNGPKILISTVDKTTDKLELNWFNNFREDDKTLYGRPLWEVARATAAAPGFFSPLKQCCIDGRVREFIDGGLRANNPSESGLTIIQDYLRQCSESGAEHRRVSLVVSIGCGDFPGKELGDLDLEKYLFPGKNFPWIPSIIKTFKNLMTMFIHAIDNSEGAASNTRSRCQEQGVAFYRFNPKFDEEIRLTETEDKILCNMIISARVHIISKLTHMEEIIQSFYEDQ